MSAIVLIRILLDYRMFPSKYLTTSFYECKLFLSTLLITSFLSTQISSHLQHFSGCSYLFLSLIGAADLLIQFLSLISITTNFVIHVFLLIALSWCNSIYCVTSKIHLLPILLVVFIVYYIYSYLQKLYTNCNSQSIQNCYPTSLTYAIGYPEYYYCQFH